MNPKTSPINTSSPLTIMPNGSTPHPKWGMVFASNDQHLWCGRVWTRPSVQFRQYLYINGWDRGICDPDKGGKMTACVSGKKSPAVTLGGFQHSGIKKAIENADNAGLMVNGADIMRLAFFWNSHTAETGKYCEPIARAVADHLAWICNEQNRMGKPVEDADVSQIMWWACGYYDRGFIANAPGSRQLRHAWNDMRLREGTEWPKSADMRHRLAQEASGFEFTLKNCNPDRPATAAAVVDPVTPATDAAAPAKGIDFTDVAVGFDPDTMSHRDLVNLARKGHEADAQIKHAYAATDAAVKELIKAQKEIASVEAERDEAVKRADMLRPVVTKYQHDGDTVEILGVKLPAQSGDHGPAPTPGYDLTAWRASMQVSDFSLNANAAQVAKAIFDGDSVRLLGPPSVGKTSGIKEVCAITGAKFFLIPCGEGATDLSLIAERTIADDRSMQWVDGHVTKAVRWAIDNPDTLCIAVLDEVDHLPAEVQSLMHSVLEGGTLVVNPQETLTVPSNMRFTCTANTSGHGDITGRHQAAKVSDTAFTSRWNATFTVTYLPPDAEARVLVGHGAAPDLAESAVRAAQDTRTEGASVSQPIVLRQLIAWAKGCANGEDPMFSWGWRVLASMPEHDRPAMREITRIHMGW